MKKYYVDGKEITAAEAKEIEAKNNEHMNSSNFDVKIFHTTQSDLQQYNGQEIRVLRPLTDNECDKADVGEMFKIQFKDGNVIDAFSDEIIEQ